MAAMTGCIIAAELTPSSSAASVSAGSASPRSTRWATFDGRRLQHALGHAVPTQGRYGFAIGTMSGGDLWLQNESGVVMHLKAKREGLMLSLGGDAMIISMNK